MQLVANAAEKASITAFIAGPCSMASAGTSSLAGALAKHHLTIVSLATAAELGKDSTAALQSLVDSMNELSGEPIVSLSMHAFRLPVPVRSAARDICISRCLGLTAGRLTSN